MLLLRAQPNQLAVIRAGGRGCVPILRRAPFYEVRCLHPLINFDRGISWMHENHTKHRRAWRPRTAKFVAGFRCALDKTASLFGPILPLSYGLILSKCGGNHHLSPLTKRSFQRRVDLKRKACVAKATAKRRNGGRTAVSATVI